MIFSATTALYIGSTPCSKAYVGTEQVWPLSTEPDWLTLSILSYGKIQFSHFGDPIYATIEYSKNGGPWTELCSSAASNYIWVYRGDILRFRGEAKYAYGSYSLDYYYNDYDESLWANNFSGSTASFNISGNILSMEYGSGFTNQTTTRISTYGGGGGYAYLFEGTKVVDAEGLILAEYRYGYSMDGRGLFYKCEQLVKAPILYNSYWRGQYENMFEYCSNLNYLKCLFEGNGIQINYFLNGTASSGIFVKSANATWARGWNGIPENWVVQNE